jgi:hypothetical protein
VAEKESKWSSVERWNVMGVVFSGIGVLLSLALSIVGIYVSGLSLDIAKKSAPDWYAAPEELRYFFTEGNLLTADGRPRTGTLSVHVENNGSTPARNIRLLVLPISSTTTFESDQQIDEPKKGPFGSKVVTIDRIPPNRTASVVIVDTVNEYPLGGYSTLRNSRFKYQYFPMVQGVETEFGSVECDTLKCGRQCARLEDDEKGTDDVIIPSHVMKNVLETIKKDQDGR